MDNALFERFNRTRLIKEYDQEKISKLSVVIAGTGALGSFIGVLLMGFGLKQITLIDNDVVENHNLNRCMTFTNDDIGKSKVNALKYRMEERNCNNYTEIIALKAIIKEKSVDVLIDKKTSVVFSCVDNVNTRFILNDFILEKNIVLINGGTGSGMFGEVCTVMRGDKPCLRCFMKMDNIKMPCSNVVDPSIVGTSAMISSLMIIEFQNLLLGKKVTPPVLKFSHGQFRDYDMNSGTSWGRRLPNPFTFLDIKKKIGCICMKYIE